MKPKFTKGPWAEYLGNGNIIEVHNNDGLEVVNWQGFDGNGNFSNQEIEANAILIASAPEMYEMLSNIANMSGGELANFVENSYEIEILLAKARGAL